MKRFSQVCFFVLVIFLGQLFAQFSGGSGTIEDPWLIRTPGNLDSLRYYLGPDHTDKHYKQISDIDLGVFPWNEGAGWEPVGRDSTFFMGHYDGDGFKIENLYINRPEESYIGLFGSAKNSNFSRINIKDAYINGRSCTGTLAGLYINSLDLNFGLISECASTGSVSGTWGTGGLIGSFHVQWHVWHFEGNRNVSDSYSRCIVTYTGDYSNSTVGGFLGDGGPVHGVTRSYSTGIITGGRGFCGGSWYDWPDLNYWDIESSGCLSSYSAEGRTTKEMTGYALNTYQDWDFINIWAEDIYGINDGYPVLQSHLKKEIPAAPSITEFTINDLEFNVSWINPTTQRNGDPLTELTAVHITRNGELIHSVNAPVSGGSENFTNILTESGYYTYRIYGENTAGLGLLCKTGHIIGQMFSGGAGTETDPYLISSPENLENIRYITGFKENKKYFLQTADIDFDVEPWNAEPYWEPIEYFTDNYDGGGFKISNFVIYDAAKNNAGLFRDTDGAVISDLNFENAGIVGYDKVGCVAGSAVSSRLKNITASVKISGNATVGGLVGYAESTIYENCNVTGEITASHTSGGLTGRLEFGSVNGCTTDITFLGTPSYSGGLIGIITGSSITRSSSKCYISGKYGLGGLIGIADSYFYSGASVISKSYSKGTIEGIGYLGGLIGEANDSFKIEDCYSFADIKGSGGTIGGFCGRSDGLYAEIVNCYSKGFVDAAGPLNSVGGFLGSVYDTDVVNSYWDMEKSGQTNSIAGEGRTTAYMTYPLDDYTYVGWDFENVWAIDPLLNGGYPYLQWQEFSGIIEENVIIPNKFALEQNYPNPFNPTTNISYSVPVGFDGSVKLQIFNSNGQLVKELVNDNKPPGKHSVNFDASGFNSGIYFYRLKAGNSLISRKMMLLK